MNRQSIVVTGASSDIGQAIIARCKIAGYEIIPLDLLPPDGARPFDVCNEEDWNRLDPAGVVGLVHAAGVIDRASLADTDLPQFRRVIDTNITGTFLALRWVARNYDSKTAVNAAEFSIATKFSAVIISSAAVEKLPENQFAYNASKAAVNVLTRQAARDLAAHNIRVNAISPGSILGGMAKAGWANPQHAARMRAEIPVGRPGEPAEIAAIALFLLQHESSYINGANIVADGAWSV